MAAKDTHVFEATAPTRVDLAGGTLDLWPINQVIDSCTTVNVGVELPARVRLSISDQNSAHAIKSIDQTKEQSGTLAEFCENKDLRLLGLIASHFWKNSSQRFELETEARSPAGAGLGGSSCLALTVAKAFDLARQHYESSPASSEEKLIHIVQDIEANVIHAPTGIQDYWGAARGGINILAFGPGNCAVETLRTGPLFQKLSEDLILCYSGQSRASAMNNWEIFKRTFDRDASVLKQLSAIACAANGVANAVKAQHYNEVVYWSGREWEERIKLWPGIETERTRALAEAARNSGATLARVCGAGGGGVMLVLASADVRSDVCAALQQGGGTVLKAGIDNKGLRAWKE